MNLPRILEKRRSTWLIRLVLNGLAQAGAAVIIALLIKFVFDHIITANGSQAMESLAWVAVGLALAALFVAWLRMTEYTDAERMGQDYVEQVRMLLFDSLRNSAVRTTQKRSRGGVMLRFIGDLTVFRRWVSLGVARLIVGGVSIAGATFALSFVNGILALAAGSMLLVGGVVVLAQDKRMQAATHRPGARSARRADRVIAGRGGRQPRPAGGRGAAAHSRRISRHHFAGDTPPGIRRQGGCHLASAGWAAYRQRSSAGTTES